MADGSDISEVSILLLGDSEVGKSAFLSRLCGGLNTPFKALPGLKDLEQPFSFDIRFTRKTFRLEFYDTSSPTSYTLLRPDVIVLCYAINDRETLTSVHKKWKYLVETHFNYDELIPVLLIGLKRDLRCEGVEGIVFPHEALGIAQAMRCDRYCECSAVTGELCREVFEDICKTAAMKTTEQGGRSEPPSCGIM
ncbi:hypothetical protein MBLNU457_4395t1 [Dothideomycetes sp. NU457]